MKKNIMVGIENGIEAIVEFLTALGIPTAHEDHEGGNFNREIKFRVYEQDYVIIWYKNEGTLKVGTHPRAPQIPFKFIYTDHTFPIHGYCLGFSYHYTPAQNLLDREFPYEVFRIPMEA